MPDISAPMLSNAISLIMHSLMDDPAWEPYFKKVEFARRLLKERSLDFFQGSLVTLTQPRAPHWNFRRNILMARQVDQAVDRFLQQTVKKQCYEPELVYPKVIQRPVPVRTLSAAKLYSSSTHKVLLDLAPSSPKRYVRPLDPRPFKVRTRSLRRGSELLSTSGTRTSSTKRSRKLLLHL